MTADKLSQDYCFRQVSLNGERKGRTLNNYVHVCGATRGICEDYYRCLLLVVSHRTQMKKVSLIEAAVRSRLRQQGHHRRVLVAQRMTFCYEYYRLL